MNLYELSRRTDQLLQDPSTAAHFSSGYEKMLEFFAVAMELQGQPGWYLEVNKRLGSDLTEEEAENLEPSLSALYGKMVGGKAPEPLYYESWTLKFFKELAEKVQEMGPFNYKDTDATDSDIQIGQAIANTLTLIPIVRAAELAENAIPGDTPKVFQTIRSIVLPYRAAGAIIHTLLGISRFRGAVSPTDSPFWRQIQSCISALLELMLGDWKSAALSLAGIYSQNAAYAGIIAQLVLNLMSMMDPDYQESIVDGITAVPKSILIGLLLHTFQTFATNKVRLSAIETLANLETNIEQKLTAAVEKSAFKDELIAAKQTGISELNFGRINLLQKMIHRKAMVCDEEFRHIFEHNNVKDNAILVILFKLMDIPITEDEYARMCPSNKWADGMFAKNKRSTAVAAPTPIVESVVSEAVPVAEAESEAAPVAEAESEAAPVAEAESEAAPVAEAESEAAPVAPDVSEAEAEIAPVVSESEAAPEAEAEIAPVAEAEAEIAPVAPAPASPLPPSNPRTNRIKGGLRRSRKKRSTSS